MSKSKGRKEKQKVKDQAKEKKESAAKKIVASKTQTTIGGFRKS